MSWPPPFRFGRAKRLFEQMVPVEQRAGKELVFAATKDNDRIWFFCRYAGQRAPKSWGFDDDPLAIVVTRNTPQWLRRVRRNPHVESMRTKVRRYFSSLR